MEEQSTVNLQKKEKAPYNNMTKKKKYEFTFRI